MFLIKPETGKERQFVFKKVAYFVAKRIARKKKEIVHIKEGRRAKG